MPSPVDRNTALLEIITEGARAVMLDRNVYAECNQHLTGECADLRQKLREAEDRITMLQQQLDQVREQVAQEIQAMEPLSKDDPLMVDKMDAVFVARGAPRQAQQELDQERARR